MDTELALSNKVKKNRRQFLGEAGTTALAATMGVTVAGQTEPALAAKTTPREEPMIWANLLHLSFNMWEDRIAPETPFRGYRSTLPGI